MVDDTNDKHILILVCQTVRMSDFKKSILFYESRFPLEICSKICIHDS